MIAGSGGFIGKSHFILCKQCHVMNDLTVTCGGQLDGRLFFSGNLPGACLHLENKNTTTTIDELRDLFYNSIILRDSVCTVILQNYIITM